ncbi:hypothetical protein WICMUC_001447 [Wickerhamomyces mucosus]|uniref:V-SNARE coiled-coil homology domain-containing protein n=1 Tax=Wickerhamomyces mucosus TaxID=1378264 RepID=A0A9P8PVL4_9ASCO|nr:hypothetical protein WICMUC_001447 [Wickerhamomyces mucosus]
MSHTEPHDTIENALITTSFSINSTVLYSLENTQIITKHKLFELKEIISNQLSIINNITSSNIGTIPIYIQSLNLTLYYLKEYVNNDLITIVTIFNSDQISLILPITLLDELIREYKASLSSSGKIEFKIRFNQIIKKNELQFQNSKDLDDELNQVKSLLNDNIEQVLERNERINLLVNKTGQLSVRGNKFNVGSKKIKRKAWWQNIKFKVIVVSIGGSLASFIIFLFSKSI